MNELGWLVWAVPALLALAVAALGSPGQLVVIAGLLAVVSFAIIMRITLERVGLMLALVFAATTPWNAVGYGLVRPADVALVAGTCCLFLAGIERPAQVRIGLPWWLVQLGVVIIVVAAVTTALPYDPTYLAHRVFLDSQGNPTVAEQSNLGLAARWLIALIGVPVLAFLARAHHPRALHRFGAAYAIGAAVSGFCAVTDRLGVTAVAARLLGPDVSYGERQTGLSLHPNLLAASCALAAPFACWMVSSAEWKMRSVGMFALAGDLSGVYLSGSRGGVAIVVPAVLASFVLLRSLRRQLLQIALALGAVTAYLLLRYPGLIETVRTTTRLNSDTTTVGSDQARSLLAQQANTDFAKSPFYGNGLSVALSAHDIFRQMLAAGGVLLTGSFIVFAALAVTRGIRYARVDQLGVPATISVATWVLVGLVENFLTDRYLYVAVAIVAAGSYYTRQPERTPVISDQTQTLPAPKRRSVAEQV